MEGMFTENRKKFQKDIIKFNNITETPLIKELDSIKEQSAYISKLGELFESNDKNDINYVIFTLSSIISNEECVDFKNETIEMIVNKNIFRELFEIIENSDEIAVVSYIALIMYNISYSFNSLNEQITNTIMNLFQDKIPLSIFTKEHLRNNKNLFEILICLLQSLSYLNMNISYAIYSDSFFVNDILLKTLYTDSSSDITEVLKLLSIISNQPKETQFELFNSFYTIFSKYFLSNLHNNDILYLSLYGIQNLSENENYIQTLFALLTNDNSPSLLSTILQIEFNKNLFIPLYHIFYNLLMANSEDINDYFISKEIITFLNSLFRFRECSKFIINIIKIFMLSSSEDQKLYIINHDIFNKVISSLTSSNLEIKIEACDTINNCLYTENKSVAVELLNKYEDLVDILIDNLINSEHSKTIVQKTLEIFLRLINSSKIIRKLFSDQKLIEVIERFTLEEKNEEISALANGIIRRLN